VCGRHPASFAAGQGEHCRELVRYMSPVYTLSKPSDFDNSMLSCLLKGERMYIKNHNQQSATRQTVTLLRKGLLKRQDKVSRERVAFEGVTKEGTR